MSSGPIKASLTLYRNTQMQEGRNIKLDDLATFLANFTKASKNDMQFPRDVFTGVDLAFKLNLDEENLLLDPNDLDGWDYVKVTLYGRNGVSESSGYYYYFIKSYEWVSQYCIRFICRMDVLNTILPSLSFTAKTIAKRQHKDRFTDYDSDAGNAYRLIDRFDEGLNPSLFRVSSGTLTEDDSSAEWNLVYRNADMPDPSDYYQINPVEAHIATDSDSSALIQSQNISQWTEANFTGTGGHGYLFIGNGVVSFTSGGTSFTPTNGQFYYIYVEADGKLSIYDALTEPIGGHLHAIGIDVQYKRLSGNILTLVNNNVDPWQFMNSDGAINLDTYVPNYDVYMTITSATIVGINTSGFDRSDPRLIKIIKVPYAPVDVAYSGTAFTIPADWEFSITWNDMKLKDINAKFSREIVFSALCPVYAAMIKAISPALAQARSADLESKLYQSPFYTVKFYYDSFSLELPLENFTRNRTAFLSAIPDDDEIHVQYTLSTTFSGYTLFSFYQYANALDRKVSDFSPLIACVRNNEEPIFTSAYVNYIRMGYNYDVKAKNLSAARGVIGLGASIAGGVVAGAMSGNPVGAAIGAIAGVAMGAINLIAQQISAENSIAQRLQNAEMQAVSVSGSDDVDLMMEYNRNRLHVAEYSVSDPIKTALFNLFYYYGYACNDTGVPSTNTRIYFNFLQADAEFTKTKNVPPALIERVVEKFAEGVTYIHKALGDSGALITAYENWETSLITP